MGKGDKKSKKGKLFQGSFGNNRPKKKQNIAPKPSNVETAVAEAATEKPAAKKAAKKKAE
ncbi:MAG: 30S ribosomal protein THX [Cytophagales bacterium]|nr:30S ribosomal protein THX [Cytophaga sp.]